MINAHTQSVSSPLGALGRGLAVTGLMALSLGLAACGDKGKISSDDMVLGDPKAPITIYEYASVTCSHCAKFNEEEFPKIKAKYIDTGKAKYVFREFLTPPASASAAGFLVARCAGKDKYFQVVDQLMRSQTELFATGDARGWVQNVAKQAGLSDDQFEKCVNDKDGAKRITDNIEKWSKDYKITGTPAFFVNDKQLDVRGREPNADDLSKLIDEAAGAKK